MTLHYRKSVPLRRSERGYILLTLILFVALIVIAAGIMAPVIAFQVKRDREEEMIHRGVQYSRALKHFVKKFGRYPTRIEELENTNEIRFLRRRYKDPITGKDFKILRLSDVQLAPGNGLAGPSPLNALAGGAPGATGARGGSNNSAANTLALAGGLAGAGQNPSNPDAGPASPPNGTPGQNADQNAGDNQADGAPNQNESHPAAGPGSPGSFGAVSQGGSSPGGQVFGGGPMVGVASISREKTIRVFSKKDHYYQWQFTYDLSTDRGGLITTPSQPLLQGAPTNLQPGTTGTPGTQGAPSGGAPGQQGQTGQPTQPGTPSPQNAPDQEP